MQTQNIEQFGEDIISNLPEEIKENILGRLPTNEAVRTCQLSSRWRSTWMSVPELQFVCPDTDSVENEIAVKKIYPRFNNLVDKALSMHKGPICKVALSISIGSYNCLNRWMGILSEKGIQDLFIENQIDAKYTVPPSFYTCHLLRYVHLEECVLQQLPCDFSGFGVLHTLDLDAIHASDDDFHHLIASCPSLENLHLKWLTSVQTICVNAARLRVLTMKKCSFRQINLETPSLEFGRFTLTDIPPVASRADIQTKTFGCLSRIKELHIHGHFMKSFGEKLPSTCNGLETLHLTMDIDDKKEAAAAIRILKNAAMLKELKIKIRRCYLQRNGNSEILKLGEKIELKHLEAAVISNFKESDSAYAFVNMLLSSAPALRRLHVKGLTGGPQLLEKLSRFEKASPAVMID